MYCIRMISAKIQCICLGEIMKNTNSPKIKNKVIRKFLSTVFITIGIFLLAFIVVVIGFNMFGISNPASDFVLNELMPKIGLGDIFSAKNEKSYFLITGTDDDGTRTDVMILGCFNSENSSINLISLPRDTKVTMPQERMAALQEMGRIVPSSGVMKLNEVHHYAGEELGIEYLEKQIFDMFNVEVDFYIKIDLDAFEYLVDEIGGVEFDVPQKMYYHDPDQDLLINLNPGVQVLNGKDAEGLVRFRSYPQGDIKRMEVQQAFIKAFAKKVLSSDNIANNASAMATAALKYVKTDFNLTKLPGYLGHFKNFKVENISTYTLPISDYVTINSKAFVVIDEAASNELIQGIFFENNAIEEEPATNKKIKVLNGGNITGLAKKGKEKLEEAGFEVKDIGDYSGTREDNTRIFVNSRGLGKDIQAVFPDSAIVFDPNLDKNYHIVVVIGKNGV